MIENKKKKKEENEKNLPSNRLFRSHERNERAIKFASAVHKGGKCELAGSLFRIKFKG